ncbi:MAG: response regulator [Verrucomicrobia bacterium]|nr:response regulator [Verrucomicrobiota bacterium]
MPPDNSPSAPPAEMKRLLVVDDDTVFLTLLKSMLEAGGHTVTTASSGVEALKCVMNAEVDAVICDLMMPRMAGDMFYMAVERLKPQLAARFIFATGNEGNSKFDEFLKRVKPVVLTKPVTLGKLLGGLMILASRAPEARRKR